MMPGPRANISCTVTEHLENIPAIFFQFVPGPLGACHTRASRASVRQPIIYVATARLA